MPASRIRQTKKEPKKAQKAVTSKSSLKNLIRDWLDDESIETKNVTQKAVHEFQFAIKYKNTPLGVLQPKNKDFIIIGVGINISPEHLKILRNQTKDERFKVMSNLGDYITERNLFHNFLFENQREFIFKTISIEGSPLFRDDIGKTMFFKHLGFTRFGYHLIVSKFRSLINVEPKFSDQTKNQDATYS